MQTAASRNSALLDLWGVLLPDGNADAFDRETLLGQYGEAVRFVRVSGRRQSGVGGRRVAGVSGRREG